MKLGVLVTFAALIAATAIAATGTASPSAENAQSPLVGTWRRTTTCAELVSALTAARVARPMVVEFVAGNGFLPGVTSPDQIADPSSPCAGAVPRVHSHFFTKDGAFGSQDWHGQPVDDGTYRITRPGTVVNFKEFPKVTFTYRIIGKNIKFTPLVPQGCSSFRCAWAVSVAYPVSTGSACGDSGAPG